MITMRVRTYDFNRLEILSVNYRFDYMRVSPWINNYCRIRLITANYVTIRCESSDDSGYDAKCCWMAVFRSGLLADVHASSRTDTVIA
jgi:hypothetical protein